jgi:hypothetical protein
MRSSIVTVNQPEVVFEDCGRSADRGSSQQGIGAPDHVTGTGFFRFVPGVGKLHGGDARISSNRISGEAFALASLTQSLS